MSGVGGQIVHLSETLPKPGRVGTPFAPLLGSENRPISGRNETVPLEVCNALMPREPESDGAGEPCLINSRLPEPCTTSAGLAL